VTESSARGSVAGTAASVLTGQLATYATGFVTSVLIARAVGAAGRGHYYLPVLAATLVVTVTSLGVESSSAMAFSERGISLSRLARLSGALALLIGPIGIALLFASYALFSHSAFAGVPFSSVAIVAVTIPLGLHQLWLTNVYLLARKLPTAQVALVVAALAQLGATALLYAVGQLDVTEVLVIQVGTLLTGWGIMVVLARRFVSLAPQFDRELARSVVGFGAKVQIGLLLSWLVLRFDVFLVSHYLGSSAVGIYSVAVLFAELAWLVTNPLQQAAFAFQAQMPLAESVPLAFKAARFNLVIATLAAAGFAATLWLVIPTLYGDVFSPAYRALLLLMPGVIAMAFCRPVTLVLVRAISPWRYAGIGALAFAANALLNVLLLPHIGIDGASIASSVAYLITAAIFCVWAARIGGVPLRQLAAFRRSDVETLRSATRGAASRLSAARPRR
jgi:O-antigen/teichoic acid export membrane protein